MGYSEKAVRIGRYLALELAVLAVAVTTASLGMSRFAAALAARSAIQRSTPTAWLVPRQEFDLRARPIARQAAGTFLGMSDELLLERIRKQPIVRVKVNRGGSSLSFRLEFADGSRAAFKPAQTNLQTIPRKEVAAYRLNRMLGLNAVPPAAPRAISREDILSHLHPDSVVHTPRIVAETIFAAAGSTQGAVSYWIPVIKDSQLDTPEAVAQSEQWLTVGQDIPPEKHNVMAQLSDLIVFDFLTSNPDRYSGGNMQMSPDGQKLFYMDNTMAFFVNDEAREINRKALLRTQRFSRHLWNALPSLSESSLRAAIAEEPGITVSSVLTDAEVRAVVSRARFARQYIRVLIEQFGEDQVLAFP